MEIDRRVGTDSLYIGKNNRMNRYDTDELNDQRRFENFERLKPQGTLVILYKDFIDIK